MGDWPRLAPHYRSVRVIAAAGGERLVEMRARRDRIPVMWWARQVVLPAERRIRDTHVRGVTRGMEVEWRITPAAGGVVVPVVPGLRPRGAPLRPVLADPALRPQLFG